MSRFGWFIFAFFGFMLLLLHGCAAQAPSGGAPRGAPNSSAPPAGGAVSTPNQSSTGNGSLSGQTPAAMPSLRRIAYGGDISVVVEDFSTAESELRDKIYGFGAYVANSDVDGSSGKPRSGRWEVRVPSEKFHEFMDAVASLGTPEMRKTKAEDKTEEFVDLRARITNKREIERRVLKLIEGRSADLREIVSLEAELGRVREEIERLQGRLDLLTKITDLSTVRIALREAAKYVPPQARTFLSQVQGTWERSFGSFVGFCKALILYGVAVTPWVPVLAMLSAFAAWLWRRATRRRVSPSLS